LGPETRVGSQNSQAGAEDAGGYSYINPYVPQLVYIFFKWLTSLIGQRLMAQKGEAGDVVGAMRAAAAADDKDDSDDE
jgi:hypothetical protein